ncbi:MAG: diguanylate cyclase [Nitrospirae bacterium]|nr:diguanylate cyclase [Nitrospirota bacterium]
MTPGCFSLDLVPDPFIVLEENACVMDINRSGSELLGDTREALIGRHFSEIASLGIFSDKVAEAIRNKVEDFDLVVFKGKHHEVFILPFRTSAGTELLRIVIKDISNFVSLEKELLKKNRELIIINTLSKTFISSENLDLVMENVLEKVLLITDFSVGWLMLRNDDASFQIRAHKGLSADFLNTIEHGGIESLCSGICVMNEPLHVIESYDIVRNDVLRRAEITFLAAVPLAYDGEASAPGILFLARHGESENGLSFELASLLRLVGNHVSMILDKIRLFQETRRLSVTDGLTGLYNSRYFYQYLDREVARSNRYGSSFSLILFDIDNFKQLNDSCGHQAGDEVLHEIARIFRGISRETDVVVRYGGEEFIIILPNTKADETMYLADRIRAAVERHVFLVNHGYGVNITMSGGIASFPENAGDVKSLLNAADVSMYMAKTQGRNRVICSRGMHNEKT